MSNVRINNIPPLVRQMARRQPRDKPLSKPMMVSLLLHICVTRPQWVKARGKLKRYHRKNLDDFTFLTQIFNRFQRWYHFILFLNKSTQALLNEFRYLFLKRVKYYMPLSIHLMVVDAHATQTDGISPAMIWNLQHQRVLDFHVKGVQLLVSSQFGEIIVNTKCFAVFLHTYSG